MNEYEKVLNEIRIYNRWKALSDESREAIRNVCYDEEYSLQYTTRNMIDWDDISIRDLVNDLVFDKEIVFRWIPKKRLPYTAKNAVAHLQKLIYHPQMGRFRIVMIGSSSVLTDRYLCDNLVERNREFSYEDLLSFTFEDGTPLGVKVSKLDLTTEQDAATILNEIVIYKKWEELPVAYHTQILCALKNKDYKLQYQLSGSPHWSDISIKQLSELDRYLGTSRFRSIKKMEYRPFTPKEIIDHLNKEVVCGNSPSKIYSIKTDCVGITWQGPIGRILYIDVTYSDLLANYKFADGSPCGVRIS